MSTYIECSKCGTRDYIEFIVWIEDIEHKIIEEGRYILTRCNFCNSQTWRKS